jgi:hypothetical protein
MKRSQYLGHNYMEAISILSSRMTLKFQKNVNFYFFDKIWIDYKDSHGNNEVPLQGFTCTSGKLTLEEAEEMVKDLKCIFVNKMYYNEYDCTFAIASSPEIMQAWYNMMHDGNCSRVIMRNFYIGGDKEQFSNSPEEREKFRTQWYKDNPCPQV